MHLQLVLPVQWLFVCRCLEVKESIHAAYLQGEPLGFTLILDHVTHKLIEIDYSLRHGLIIFVFIVFEFAIFENEVAILPADKKRRWIFLKIAFQILRAYEWLSCWWQIWCSHYLLQVWQARRHASAEGHLVGLEEVAELHGATLFLLLCLIENMVLIIGV